MGKPSGLQGLKTIVLFASAAQGKGRCEVILSNGHDLKGV